MILLLNFSEGLGQVTIYLYTINEKTNWVIVLPTRMAMYASLITKSDHFKEHQMI